MFFTRQDMKCPRFVVYNGKIIKIIKVHRIGFRIYPPGKYERRKIFERPSDCCLIVSLICLHTILGRKQHEIEFCFPMFCPMGKTFVVVIRYPFCIEYCSCRGAQLKFPREQKLSFWNIQGPKIIWFYSFKGCFYQTKKVKNKIFGCAGQI